MELVKSHDGPKEEKGEVEVVLEQVTQCVVAILLLAVLQRKAHTAKDGETKTSVEQDILQVKRTGHQGFLKTSNRTMFNVCCTDTLKLNFQPTSSRLMLL